MGKGYIVRWQSDLAYTIEYVLPGCDKPYHINNGFQQMWADIENVWTSALYVSNSFWPFLNN